MKILTITGSPRKKGNTANVLDMFENLMADQHEIDRVTMASHQVNGCLGCGACMEKDHETGCIQNDDAASIFERMLQADLLVYASPLYWWGFSAQIKALIDRHLCMIKDYGTPEYRSLLDGKRVSLMVTCDGQIEGNADLIQGIFQRVSDYCKCKVVGKYIVPFCLKPETIGTLGRETARQMAMDTCEAFKI